VGVPNTDRQFWRAQVRRVLTRRLLLRTPITSRRAGGFCVGGLAKESREVGFGRVLVLGQRDQLGIDGHTVGDTYRHRRWHTLHERAKGGTPGVEHIAG
jgi:hypothetical protein